MKPLERIFFQACWMCCTHIKNGVHRGKMSVKEVVNTFIAFGFPQNMLYYYLDKWAGKDFYNYGVALHGGWFEDDKLTGEYKALAEQAEKYHG